MIFGTFLVDNMHANKFIKRVFTGVNAKHPCLGLVLGHDFTERETVVLLIGGNLIVFADQGRSYAPHPHLHESIMQGAGEGDPSMRIGGVVAVVLRIDGDQRGHSVVRGLHETGRHTHRLTLSQHAVKYLDRILHTAQSCSVENGIRLRYTTDFHSFKRRNKGPFLQFSKATRLHGRKVSSVFLKRNILHDSRNKHSIHSATI